MARSRVILSNGFFIIGVVSLIIVDETRLWCLLIALISFLTSSIINGTFGNGK